MELSKGAFLQFEDHCRRHGPLDIIAPMRNFPTHRTANNPYVGHLEKESDAWRLKLLQLVTRVDCAINSLEAPNPATLPIDAITTSPKYCGHLDPFTLQAFPHHYREFAQNHQILIPDTLQGLSLKINARKVNLITFHRLMAAYGGFEYVSENFTNRLENTYTTIFCSFPLQHKSIKTLYGRTLLDICYRSVTPTRRHKSYVKHAMSTIYSHSMHTY